MPVTFRSVLAVASILSGLAGLAQTMPLRVVTTLPVLTDETSGILAPADSCIWTHKDSGNEPWLYKVDTTGKVTRGLQVVKMFNTDWEDITTDRKGRVFIGDIGNNLNDRKDLRILIIPDPDGLTQDTITPGVIRFSYEGQTAFPPAATRLNYDAEALVHYGSHLYIFTKNRTEPFTGYTYMFRVPDTAGTYQAVLTDSFKTGNGMKELWWVTSAAMSPDGKKLVLLSHDKMWVFTGFTDDQFFKGQVKKFDFTTFTQKEAIAFINNTDFYITDEVNTLFGGMKLYRGSLKGVSLRVPQVKKNDSSTGLIPERTAGGFRFWNKQSEGPAEYILSDLSGREVLRFGLNHREATPEYVLAEGVYIVRCLTLEGSRVYRIHLSGE